MQGLVALHITKKQIVFIKGLFALCSFIYNSQNLEWWQS